MAFARGRSTVKRFIKQIPIDMEAKVLRGAARAAATIVADEAKELSISSEVSGAIKIATQKGEGQIIAKVQVKGPGAFIAPWLEYGTAPHFISVDESQRDGMSVARINKAHKEGSLVIGGKFVGQTVFHPGARPHPFLRPALDRKQTEAVAAAQGYINSRVTRRGIVGSSEPEGGDA